VVSKFQRFPNSSGFQETTGFRKPLEFGNHWNLETTGIWKPLEFENHWNLETDGIWKPLDFRSHRNVAAETSTYIGLN
jgi:hypothetical protein